MVAQLFAHNKLLASRSEAANFDMPDGNISCHKQGDGCLSYHDSSTTLDSSCFFDCPLEEMTDDNVSINSLSKERETDHSRAIQSLKILCQQNSLRGNQTIHSRPPGSHNNQRSLIRRKDSLPVYPSESHTKKPLKFLSKQKSLRTVDSLPPSPPKSHNNLPRQSRTTQNQSIQAISQASDEAPRTPLRSEKSEVQNRWASPSPKSVSGKQDVAPVAPSFRKRALSHCELGEDANDKPLIPKKQSASAEETTCQNTAVEAKAIFRKDILPYRHPSLLRRKSGLKLTDAEEYRALDETKAGSSLDRRSIFMSRTMSRSRISHRGNSSVLSPTSSSTLRPLLPFRRRRASSSSVSRLLGKTNSKELNIFGSDMVSTDFILDQIREAKENPDIVKLELEDLLEGCTTEVATALQDLLCCDDRPWEGIKFVDEVRIQTASCDRSLQPQKNPVIRDLRRLCRLQMIPMKFCTKVTISNIPEDSSGKDPNLMPEDIADMLRRMQKLRSITVLDLTTTNVTVDIVKEITNLFRCDKRKWESVQLNLSCTGPFEGKSQECKTWCRNMEVCTDYMRLVAEERGIQLS